MKIRSTLLALLVVIPAFAEDFDRDPDRGDGYRRQQISRAAHEVSESAEHFHRVIHNLTGYSHFATDAHRLSEAAEHFHQAAEQGSSLAHLVRDYFRLQSQYRHLASAYYRAHRIHHSRHVERDWQRLEHAAEELNYAVYGSSHGDDDDHGGPGHGGGRGRGRVFPFPIPY